MDWDAALAAFTSYLAIERNYSPLWSLWRAEKNGTTGAASESLLWNLYRHEDNAGVEKCSLLFGLFRYQSAGDGARWRLFYFPAGKTNNPVRFQPLPEEMSRPAGAMEHPQYDAIPKTR